MLAQLETGLKIVDKASAASDRWLFLFALGIIILGGAVVIRWLVASLERKDRAHDANMSAISEKHASERNEWRNTQMEAKAGFLEALKQQRDDFRDELALERVATSRMADTVQKMAAQIAACAQPPPPAP